MDSKEWAMGSNPSEWKTPFIRLDPATGQPMCYYIRARVSEVDPDAPPDSPVTMQEGHNPDIVWKLLQVRKEAKQMGLMVTHTGCSRCGIIDSVTIGVHQ